MKTDMFVDASVYMNNVQSVNVWQLCMYWTANRNPLVTIH